MCNQQARERLQPTEDRGLEGASLPGGYSRFAQVCVCVEGLPANKPSWAPAMPTTWRGNLDTDRQAHLQNISEYVIQLQGQVNCPNVIYCLTISSTLFLSITNCLIEGESGRLPAAGTSSSPNRHSQQSAITNAFSFG